MKIRYSKKCWARRVAWSILLALGARDSSSNLGGPTSWFLALSHPSDEWLQLLELFFSLLIEVPPTALDLKLYIFVNHV